MNLTNDTNFIKELDKDVENLSKALYLENPDLWISFIDISTNKNFDEMSLFFATKNNMLSIVRYAVEINNLDLNKPSKNKEFSSIRESLLDVSKKYNSDLVLDYLSEGTLNEYSYSSSTTDVEYICPNCKSNIFKCGYNVLIASTCTYSSSIKKIIRSKPFELDKVICTNCNFELNDITPSQLESFTNIDTCINCSSNLGEVGVIKEVGIKFNRDNHSFVEDKPSYCCKSCRKELENNQLSHFKLI
ncbi:MAG: hypothetical protein ACRCXT_19955 [Paraclostridium sp.]